MGLERTIRLIALSFILMSSLAGCVTPLTTEQLAAADYGNITSNYKSAIEDYMQSYLIDPYSAHYRYFGEPVKGYAYVRGTINPPEFGYLVNVGINAKNRMGGYTGEKPYLFLFKNDTFWMLQDYTTYELAPPRLDLSTSPSTK